MKRAPSADLSGGVSPGQAREQRQGEPRLLNEQIPKGAGSALGTEGCGQRVDDMPRGPERHAEGTRRPWGRGRLHKNKP